MTLAYKEVRRHHPNEDLHGTVVDRHGRPAGWHDAHSSAIFLIMSGPSLKQIDKSAFTRRGIVTLAVNNAATVLKPTYWVHTDPVQKFHCAIWHDASVIKFTPCRGWKKRTRILEDGEWRWGPRARDCQNVWGYQRNTTFDPPNFLTEATINRGNSNRACRDNGYPHCINTMFTALRFGYFLGFRRAYLVGCDFNMDYRQPYAFEEGKRPDACDSNNGSYEKIRRMIQFLVPVFTKHGYQVYNCNPQSKLEAFPFTDFTEAIEKESIPDVTDTRGWYDKARSRRDPRPPESSVYYQSGASNGVAGESVPFIATA